jgi:hypothetical protein
VTRAMALGPGPSMDTVNICDTVNLPSGRNQSGTEIEFYILKVCFADLTSFS